MSRKPKEKVIHSYLEQNIPTCLSIGALMSCLKNSTPVTWHDCYILQWPDPSADVFFLKHILKLRSDDYAVFFTCRRPDCKRKSLLFTPIGEHHVVVDKKGFSSEGIAESTFSKKGNETIIVTHRPVFKVFSSY